MRIRIEEYQFVLCAFLTFFFLFRGVDMLAHPPSIDAAEAVVRAWQYKSGVYLLLSGLVPIGFTAGIIGKYLIDQRISRRRWRKMG